MFSLSIGLLAEITNYLVRYPWLLGIDDLLVVEYFDIEIADYVLLLFVLFLWILR